MMSSLVRTFDRLIGELRDSGGFNEEAWTTNAKRQRRRVCVRMFVCVCARVCGFVWVPVVG